MVKIGDTLNKIPTKTAIAAVFIMNVVMRGWFSTAHPVWGDEAYSLYFSQFDFSEIITVLMSGYNPPFFEIFLHLFHPLPIEHPEIFRWLSVLCVSISGTLLFQYLYIRNKQAAWVFILLFCGSNLLMNMSQFMRVYPLEILLVTILFILTEKKNLTALSLLFIAILSSLLLYFHYVPIILFPFLLIHLKLKNISNKKWLFFLTSLLLFSLPILYFLLIKMTNGSVDSIKQDSSISWETFEKLNHQIFNGVPFFFLASFILIIAHHVEEKKQMQSGTSVMGALPFFALFLIAMIFPVADRYFSLILPLYCAAVAHSVAYYLNSKSRKNLIHVGVLFVLLALYFASKIQLRFPYNDLPNSTAQAVISKFSRNKIIVSPQFITLPLMYHLSPEAFGDIAYTENKIQHFRKENYQVYSKAAYESFESSQIFSINEANELPIFSDSDTCIIWIDSKTEEIVPEHGIPQKIHNLGYEETGIIESDWKTKIHFYRLKS